MNYRKEVLRTADIKDFSSLNQLINSAMGLCGESGEFSELIKKHVFYGTPLDEQKAIKELGDIRWYLELAAYCLNVSMDEIEQINVDKLRERYPDGFVRSTPKETVKS